MRLLTAVERRQVFEQAMRDHGRGLTQLAFCLCRDRSQAEEFTAEAFARTWRRWEDGKVDELVPYLRRTVVNLAKQGWRKELLGRRRQSQLISLLSTGGHDQSSAGGFELVDAVLRLPRGQRAVVVLRYFEDLSEQETAELLEISTGTVKSRTSRALTSLRSLYEGDPHA